MLGFEKNMGVQDRSIRAILGSLLLLQGLSKPRQSKLALIGVAGGITFLAQAMSGFDPLLGLLKTSTDPSDDRNIWNLLKQAKPGHGDKPINLQQPAPRKSLHQNKETLASFLSVGT